MKLSELLRKLKDDKTRIMINGLGTGDVRGLITEVNDDYIIYELYDAKKEKNSGKEKSKKEVKYIPISSIYEMSEGEKEVISTPNLSTFNK
jgi:hypothetical protein